MIKLCIKCGAEGHANRTCREPVTSYGIIIYRHAKEGELKGRLHPFVQSPCNRHTEPPNFHQRPCRENEILFYLVERKDTIGFLNIVQGNYNETTLRYAVDQLTCEERLKLRVMPFETLWGIAGTRKKDMQYCKNRFQQTDWAAYLDRTQCLYREGDFLMPKGRLQYHESVMRCAIREFSEESGYPEDAVELLRMKPYQETFTGPDAKLYRNVYFVGRLKDTARVTVNLGDDVAQSKEVRNMGFFNIVECQALIRNYHYMKKHILMSVYRSLAEQTCDQAEYSKWFIRTSSYNRIKGFLNSTTECWRAF